jgi:transketolase C-terminal domain/subunit
MILLSEDIAFMSTLPNMKILGLDDYFAESGNYLSMIDKYGFAAAKIIETAERLLLKGRNTPCRILR